MNTQTKTKNHRSTRFYYFCIFFLSFLFLFTFLGAPPLFAAFKIPCDGGAKDPCTFVSFVQLLQNLINYLILISIPLSAIAFSVAGFMIVTAAGDEGKIKEGKEIFKKVFIGFLFVLGAWLIVYTITKALLNDDALTNYNLLK